MSSSISFILIKHFILISSSKPPSITNDYGWRPFVTVLEIHGWQFPIIHFNFFPFIQLLHALFTHIPSIAAVLTKYLWWFFCLSFVWHVSTSTVCLTKHRELVGSPHLNTTIVFGVLLMQNIPSSFLSEHTWKIFILCIGVSYIVQDLLPYKSVLWMQVHYTLTPWSW